MTAPRTALFLLLAVVTSTLWGDPLEQAIKQESATLQSAIHSQERIDKIDDNSRKMLEEYWRTLREADTLRSYTSNLRQLVESQEREKKALEHQIEEIALAERQIVPLMVSMVETLEEFVDADTPFLPVERRQRVESLKSMLDSAEITTAEKFRRILEAYQIENEYAVTIEAYRADLSQEGTTRPVDFLRIGRVALFYQSLDGSTSGFWNPRKKTWEILPDDFRRPIRDGIRIARKEAAPDLLTLPMPAAETAK